MKNVKYGKCVRCGKTYEATPDLTNCECGGILDIVYDYDYIKSVLTKEKLARRENRSFSDLDMKKAPGRVLSSAIMSMMVWRSMA